jgi:hypothetical protein
MPSTTVHIPEPLLHKMNMVVKEKGISRNRFIVLACEQALKNDAGQWPEGFFSQNYGDKKLKLLRKNVKEMEAAIFSNRKNRAPVDL